MKKVHFLIFSSLFFILSTVVFAQTSATKTRTIQLEPGEKWWGGAVSESHKAPYSPNYSINLYGNNKSNQAQPLLISSKGRYIWSEEPFGFSFTNTEIIIDETNGAVQQGKAGETLPEVYKFVSRKYFPASGKMPDRLLFTSPQWNTWIELTYNHNQEDILKYARNIIANGFEPGVLMIDDTWQENYGMWNFHPGRFHDPKAMMDELHKMGFKVMLWICPFVSADTPPYRELKAKKGLLRENDGTAGINYQNAKTEPSIIRWWNGASAVLDLTSPAGYAWFKAQMDRLQKEYGVDGFKLDAGDSGYYPANAITFKQISPNAHTELFGQIGLNYPLNEYRAMWKMAGQPIAERLWDKGHNWEDLQKLIPQVAAQGLMGYAFTCPDMMAVESGDHF